ncbi:MAG TPA: hypothetical protein VF066_16460 [Thermoleophilaceae bacterium]
MTAPTTDAQGLRCATCGTTWSGETARQLIARAGECPACQGPIAGPEVGRIRDLLGAGEHLATVADLALHRLGEEPPMLREAVRSWRRAAGDQALAEL